MIKEIYNLKYEELDEIIKNKIKENEQKFKDINNTEENNNIKNSIIMEEMYKQGFKDGINLIIECRKQN